MSEQMHIVSNVHNHEQQPVVVAGGVVAAIVVAREMADESFCRDHVLEDGLANIVGMTFAQSVSKDSPSNPVGSFDIAIQINELGSENMAQSRTYRFRIKPIDIVTIDKPYLHVDFSNV